MDRRCPDCGVTMEPITVRAGGYEANAYTGESQDGLLGRLGVEKGTDVDHVACPECGLLRAYLDAE